MDNPNPLELFAGFCEGAPGGEHRLVLTDASPVARLEWQVWKAGGEPWRGVHLIDLSLLQGLRISAREAGIRAGRECAADLARQIRQIASSNLA